MKFLLLIVMGVITAAQEESLFLKDFAVGSNKFTADVYRELLKSHYGNFLVCPLSAETVLALVHTGAGGQTAQQLAAGLHLPENKEKIQETFRKLAPHLKGNENYTLSSANKVYVKNGYQIQDQFKNIAVSVFEADIQNINFEKAQQAASEMNKWVEEKTHNKIKNLIEPDSLSEDTRSILINAMYFHGKWATQFDKDSTSKEYFHLNNTDKTKTDMMRQTDYFSYHESSKLNATFLELPYAGDDITMTFVLPNDESGLGALEKHIDDVFVTPIYYYPRVIAVIPKFTIKSTIEFKPILQELGVKDAFEDYAEFNDILVDQPVKINKVLQKTFVEVEEEGTTAAAVTYVDTIIPISLNYRPPPIKQFIADHPFIFYIKLKDVVFFAGRYTSPN